MVDFFPGEFFINGKSSIKDYKTIIQDRPDISVPKRKMKITTPYAFNGAVAYDEHAYDNTEMTLKLAIISDEATRADYRRKLFYALSTGLYVDIEFYFDPGMIYRCLLVENYSYQNKGYFEGVQITEIKLSVEPYKRFKSSHTTGIQLVKNGVNQQDVQISAPKPNAVSFPTFEVIGSGEIQLLAKEYGPMPPTDDDPGYVLKNMESQTPIIIHNDFKMVYGFTSNRFNDKYPFNANNKLFSRDFMTISRPHYSIKLVGNMEHCLIYPNWRILV